jgi:4-diphosphocytidyl-2-C-methyl-D-erythritol kinase
VTTPEPPTAAPATTSRAPAPGKVNLCLFLGGSRPDGRHELVTLVESVSLADELTLTTLPSGSADEVICRPPVDGRNLVHSALELLRASHWLGPPVRIEIEKRIPVAAGMGGGSADAAAALRLARRLAPVAEEQLLEIAGRLGADVPSQLNPGLAIGTGAGERVAPQPPLASHALVIVPSAERLATATVYAEADRLGLPRPAGELDAVLAELETVIVGPGAVLSERLLVNDLEPAARSLCPAIDRALAAAMEAGAQAALVSGSGPTVAGVFWGEDALQHASEAAEALSGHYPGASAVVPVSSSASGTIGPSDE